MAFNFNNILNIAGNWWKGAPAPVYYDMYQNDNDFDEAATNFYDEAVNNDLGGLGEEDFFADLADQPDDEFLLEKAIYQVDKPDVLMTPYGPALSPDIVASVVQEYPAITALAASPGEETNPDDFYDGWGDYFDEAESFSKDADDEINQIMDAVGDRTMIEGKIGEEPNILQAAGQQISDAFQGFMGLGDDIGLVDNVKGVMSNMADMFKSVQPMAIGMGGSLGTGDAPAPTGMEDQPMDVGGPSGLGNLVMSMEDMAKTELPPQAYGGYGSTSDSSQEMNQLFDLPPQEIIENIQNMGYTAEEISDWMNSPGWRVGAEQTSNPAILTSQINMAFPELMGDPLDPVAPPLVATPQPVAPGNVDIEGYLNTHLAESLNPPVMYPADASSGPIVQQSVKAMLSDAPTLSDVPTDTGVSTGLQDTVTGDPTVTPVPTTTATPVTTTQGTETGLDISSAKGDAIPDEGLKWDQDLQKVFYKKMYAEPGMGRSDVLKDLPTIFNQTKAMFLALKGPEMWDDLLQPVVEADKLDKLSDATEVAKAKASLEAEYQEFLSGYLSNPSQALANPDMRANIMRISDILQKYEDNPDTSTWNAVDFRSYNWISALFGDDYIGRVHRDALIGLQISGGGLGRYSNALRASASRQIDHLRKMGWTESRIFQRMMGIRGEQPAETATRQFRPETLEDLRIEDQPMDVGGDYGISAITGADPADMGSKIWDFAEPTKPVPTRGDTSTMPTQPFVPDFVPETPEDLMVLDQLMDVGGASTQPFVPERPAFVPETLDDLRIEDQAMAVGGVNRYEDELIRRAALGFEDYINY